MFVSITIENERMRDVELQINNDLEDHKQLDPIQMAFDIVAINHEITLMLCDMLDDGRLEITVGI